MLVPKELTLWVDFAEQERHIGGAGHDDRFARMEDCSGARASMTWQLVQNRRRLYVPDGARSIRTSCHDLLAIRTPSRLDEQVFESAKRRAAQRAVESWIGCVCVGIGRLGSGANGRTSQMRSVSSNDVVSRCDPEVTAKRT